MNVHNKWGHYLITYLICMEGSNKVLYFSEGIFIIHLHVGTRCLSSLCIKKLL